VILNNAAKSIYVYAHWTELNSPFLMGCLHTQTIRGQEMFSFEFTPDWLKSKSGHILDPDLKFYAGRQYAHSAKTNFGIFLDSAPDRWGRQLLRRREAIRARKAGRAVRRLAESDYLLEIHDATRMGAIRFKMDMAGEFISHESDMPVPPWTSLSKLETACRHYEKEPNTDQDEEKWLDLLLAPGSSLGGARPKANIADDAGNLWIAKFPSRGDVADIAAWEMTVHELARRAGLLLPECRLAKLSRHGCTFLSKRFDRKSGQRIHFASAMTLLGKTDGDNHATGCGYLDLAQFNTQYGVTPRQDLEELWRRIVFYIATSNTDDHLRNHGFLLTRPGWKLAPAYDMNPSPYGGGLSLNISADDNSPDFDLALSVASQFRLKINKAKTIIKTIKDAVNRWRVTALKHKIPRREIESMAPAFHP